MDEFFIELNRPDQRSALIISQAKEVDEAPGEQSIREQERVRSSSRRLNLPCRSHACEAVGYVAFAQLASLREAPCWRLESIPQGLRNAGDKVL
jgi:hypothetical protein